MSTRTVQDLSFAEATLLDTPALFTTARVEQRSIPEGMFRYEIRADGQGAPAFLAKAIQVNLYGTVLTLDPIQLPVDGFRPLHLADLVICRGASLEAFAAAHRPENRDIMEIRPMRAEEMNLFFSMMEEEKDAAVGCIGHVRGDFESGRLYTTWWPHHWDAAYNKQPFKGDLQRVVDWLRTGFAPLKDFSTMREYCRHYEKEARIPGQSEDCFGFRIDTSRFCYMLRCTPLKGWYHMYLYCYSKDAVKGEQEGSKAGGCGACRHNAGCLVKGMLLFRLFIMTGRDREYPKDVDALDMSGVCGRWEAQS